MSEEREMMTCGHAANAVLNSRNGEAIEPPLPCCAICDCSEVAEGPSLEGRTAVCSYTGCRQNYAKSYKRMRSSSGDPNPDYGRYDKAGRSVADSSMDLPFFEHRPDKEVDRFYCGCFGWN